MTISYLNLVSGILRNFRNFKNQSDIIIYFGPNGITDISDAPASQIMDMLSPLPNGFTEGAFKFNDLDNNLCVFDVTFYQNKLVNFRGQKYFRGWFALGKAIKFNSFKLRPLIN